MGTDIKGIYHNSPQTNHAFYHHVSLAPCLASHLPHTLHITTSRAFIIPPLSAESLHLNIKHSSVTFLNRSLKQLAFEPTALHPAVLSVMSGVGNECFNPPGRCPGHGRRCHCMTGANRQALHQLTDCSNLKDCQLLRLRSVKKVDY